ncbi:hypothetical protein [Agromyces sp. NPDC055658]
MEDDRLPVTEPDCPNCCTRTMHRPQGEYWCRNCEVIVVDFGSALS